MNSNDVIECLKAFGTGAACGAIFTWLKLPIPAPGVFAGIVGIIGVFVGYIVVRALLH